MFSTIFVTKFVPIYRKKGVVKVAHADVGAETAGWEAFIMEKVTKYVRERMHTTKFFTEAFFRPPIRCRTLSDFWTKAF